MHGAIWKFVKEALELIAPVHADRLTEQYDISYNEAIRVMEHVKNSKAIQDVIDSLEEEALNNLEAARKEADVIE